MCSHTGASLVWAVICWCEQLLRFPSVVIPQHLSKSYLHFPALYSGLVSLKLYPPNIMYQILVNNLIIHKLRVDVVCSHRTSARCPSKSFSTKLRILNLELPQWTFTSVCSPGPVGTLRQATLMVSLLHSGPVKGWDGCKKRKHCSFFSRYVLLSNPLKGGPAVERPVSPCGNCGAVTPCGSTILVHSELKAPHFRCAWRTWCSTSTLMCMDVWLDSWTMKRFMSIVLWTQVYELIL